MFNDCWAGFTLKKISEISEPGEYAQKHINTAG